MADFPGELKLDNDFLVRAGAADEPLLVEHPTTGVVGPFTGQTLTAFLSTTDVYNATALDADVTITMTESGTVPGFYLGNFQGQLHTPHTAAYVDQPLFVHVQDPNGVEQIMVRDPRTGA